MRILHVTTIGLTAQVFLLPLLQRLQREGHEVWLACSDDDNARFVEQQGIAFFPVTIRRTIRPADVRSVLRLRRFMREQRFDLVNTHTAKGGSVGRIAARLAGVPRIVHTMHGITFHAYLPRPLQCCYWCIERLLACWTTCYIAVTEVIRRRIVSAGLAPAERVQRIYNGLDLGKFSPDAVQPAARLALRTQWRVADHTCVIGVVSRLVPDKGLDDALAAFARLQAGNPDTLLVIAGDGPLERPLKAHAAALGIANAIRWLGWHDNVPELLSAFDIFCLPTLREGFGYAFLEAQAMGLPVVATNIEPLTETMAPNETALLVPPHSPAAVAAALEQLVRDAALRTALGARGRQRVRDLFDQERQLDAVVALYASLAAAPAGD